MDYLKYKLKKKIMIFVLSNILPILLVIILVSSLIAAAGVLGTWISDNVSGTVSTDNTNWVDGINPDVISNSYIDKKLLKEMLKAEEDSYMSTIRTFTLTYLDHVYDVELDEDGNIVLNQYGFPNYIYIESIEREYNYDYDMADATYEFRLPWQLVYAVSLVASLNNEDTYIDPAAPDEYDSIEDNTSNINVSKRTVKKVIKALQTKYHAVYDYYGSGNTYYSYSLLSGLPHVGTSDNYIPQTVFRKIETCLYDYNYSITTSSYDRNSYVVHGVTSVQQKDRFLSALNTIGCDETTVDIIIEILKQLGGCEELVISLNVMFNLSGSDSNTDGVIVDIGDVELTDITRYALQYVGNPYVYGGTNLMTGIDCSAYVQAIYRKFGVNLPRTSREQVKVGAVVHSIADARPGDLIFYATNGVVHHVALYLGNNKIVHASNSKPYPRGGIKVTNNAQYNTIYAIRRVAN